MCCCNGCLSDICLVILSVLFPPLPVWIRRGICSCDSLINICLFILGYFPGLIHSWYIIAKYPPYSDIYYVYRSDLEHQVPCCDHQHHHHHHSHHHSHTHDQVSTVIYDQPRAHSTPLPMANPTYGSMENTEQTIIGPLAGHHDIDPPVETSIHAPMANPPPYSEFNGK